ncbi:MAG: hypothetical protein KKF46_02855 [Nanoarchaeota archaeon]|nr:hypothetical protein [Nanoarchaeota archaeon]MBU1321272.1 hypothetical protein [Nanoarchaeota archaeon]MBU1597102.1 hypothetical protein [Nanoarchaeota archaeon]MBU2442155.1 hypothetical protein [Nanoarchaeota archaeon]
MDKAIFVVGIIGPLMTIPQVLKIWVAKNATSISLISWIVYTIQAVFWLIYGILHKEKPIIYAYVCWIVLDVLIVIGTIIYG